MNIVPFNNYIVVTPKGDVIGFQEEEEARTYISGYYTEKIKELSEDRNLLYVDYQTDPLQSAIDICVGLGVYEGDYIIYNLHSFIENIRESGIFQEEKDEIIGKLLNESIHLNINDYTLDDILFNTEVVPRSR